MYILQYTQSIFDFFVHIAYRNGEKFTASIDTVDKEMISNFVKARRILKLVFHGGYSSP